MKIDEQALRDDFHNTQRGILERGTAAVALAFTNRHKDDSDLDLAGLVDVVARAGDASEILKMGRLASRLGFSDVLGLQRALAERAHETELQEMLLFTRDVDGASIEIMEDSIVERGEAAEACQAAALFPEVNVQRMKGVILSQTDDLSAYAATSMAVNGRLLEPGDIAELQSHVIKYGAPNVMRDFANRVKDADVVALEKAALKTGNMAAAMEFYDLPGADKELIIEALIERRDSDNAIGLMKDMAIDDPDIADRLAAMTAEVDAVTSFQFARDFSSLLSIERRAQLLDKVISTPGEIGASVMKWAQEERARVDEIIAEKDSDALSLLRPATSSSPGSSRPGSAL